jgi:all-trans-8'-apo-beta-carotenal 15,15'-oxygenase
VLQVANERYKRHTFDGDGMVLSFSFDQGRVWFKNKFVRTKGFVDEQVIYLTYCITMVKSVV